jgi:N-acetylmuramoyl-L-alanine amidase
MAFLIAFQLLLIVGWIAASHHCLLLRGGPLSAFLHRIVQGECAVTLGAKYGFDWHTIWDHPQNEKLRTKRRNPHVLMPGDTVYIPEVQGKTLGRPSDARHYFCLKSGKELLRVRLLDELGRPRAGLNYEMEVEGAWRKGVTSAQGEIREWLRPGVAEAKFYLGDEGEELPVRIGHLDPADELSGAQARLANLGYEVGAIDGVLGPETKVALSEFQHAYSLEPTGALDDATAARLIDLHGH